VKCPASEELAAWLDRELPERRAGEVAAHVATCTVCTATVARLQRVIGSLRAPVGHASADQVSRTLARLDELAPRASRAWIGGIALALAATAAVVWFVRPARDDTFTARGGSDGGLDREVGATIYTLSSRAEPLAAGTRVAPSTAYVIGYRDLAAAPMWTLAFAVDSHDDVHWLYPAYTSGDPAAVALTPGQRETLMPDAAVLDHPAQGALRIVVMIIPSQLPVSAIEALHGDELALPALRRRFSTAVISELRVVVP